MTSPQDVLIELTKWEVTILLGGFFGTVTLRLLTGRINTRHLLWTKGAEQVQQFSSERLQLLVATIAIAVQYLLSAANANGRELPRLPNGALVVLGLSNVIYLGCKGWKAFRSGRTETGTT